MKYRIIIKKVDTVDVVEKEWKKLRDIPDEIKKDYYIRGRQDELEEYGYVPCEETKEVETDVLDQVREGEINLVDVIMAFNGLKPVAVKHD